MKKEKIVMECPPLFPRDKMDILIDLWGLSLIMCTIAVFVNRVIQILA